MATRTRSSVAAEALVLLGLWDGRRKGARLPAWISWWLVVSSLICCWDASFVFFRPASMLNHPKGDAAYARFWPGYDVYVTIDKAYGDVEDVFVIAQSIMNVIEVVVNVAAVVRSSILLGYSASLMTLAKTTLYVVYNTLHGATSHLEWSSFIVAYVLPNGIWIVMPALVCVLLGKQIVGALVEKQAKVEQAKVEKQS